MSIFANVLKDEWNEVENEVNQMIDNIKNKKIQSEKVNVLSQINKMTPDQVSKMMGM